MEESEELEVKVNQDRVVLKDLPALKVPTVALKELEVKVNQDLPALKVPTAVLEELEVKVNQDLSALKVPTVALEKLEVKVNQDRAVLKDLRALKVLKSQMWTSRNMINQGRAKIIHQIGQSKVLQELTEHLVQTERLVRQAIPVCPAIWDP